MWKSYKIFISFVSKIDSEKFVTSTVYQISFRFTTKDNFEYFKDSFLMYEM